MLKHLRSLMMWCRNHYELEEYRLTRMGFKRIGSHVSCRMEFDVYPK